MAFEGREPEIAEILSGHRDSLWVVGGRRIGKTSLLREVERRAAGSAYVPLFWSLGEKPGLDELNESLKRAWTSVDSSEIEGGDVFTTLRAAARRLRSRENRLLLLCDDAEGWIEPARQDASVLRRLRRALHSADNVRTVLASTLRLWELAEERSATSPFLGGFTPPVYLGPLDREAASRMVPGSVGDEVAVEICDRCGNHPWLVRSVCERLAESGTLETVFDDLVTNEGAIRWFDAEVEGLTELEYNALRQLAWPAECEAASVARELDSEADGVATALQRLDRLGFARRSERGHYRVASEPFHRWLMRRTSERAEAIVQSLDESVSAKLLGLAYDDLHAQARRYMHRERAGHTLQPTALVNEAYLRLADQSRVSWQGRTHFLAMGAAMMRRVLVDHARGRKRVKRGADWVRVTLSDWLTPMNDQGLDTEQLLTLDRALTKLAEISERQARIVEMRFFGGLKVEEVAEALGVSKRTVEGDWSSARAWLSEEISDGGHDSA